MYIFFSEKLQWSCHCFNNLECKTLLIYVCSKGREWPSRKKLIACLERASADSFTKIHRWKFFSEFIILINAYLTTGKKFRENKFTTAGRTLFPLHRFLWIKYLLWTDSTAFYSTIQNTRIRSILKSKLHRIDRKKIQ